jgi:hypothetical protein
VGDVERMEEDLAVYRPRALSASIVIMLGIGGQS